MCLFGGSPIFQNAQKAVIEVWQTKEKYLLLKDYSLIQFSESHRTGRVIARHGQLNERVRITLYSFISHLHI